MDHERYKQAIAQRVSVRRFTGGTIAEDKLAKLRGLVDTYNEESGLSMRLVTGDNAPFEGKQASGLFQGSAGYLALIGKTDDPQRMEKEGYYGELFVLEATSMGIGTCWVASSFGKDKSSAVPKEGETLDLAIVFGIAEKKLSFKEKMVRRVIGRNAKTIGDVAPDAEAAPEWFRAGADAVMKAPSTKNTRPFLFTFENDEARAKTVGNHERVMVDLGIAKLHFEIGAGGGKWDMGDNALFVRNA